jgi:creatinine amidohydrolase
MLEIAPQLVRPLGEAGSGDAKTFRIKAFREGWASTQRQWTKVTEDTGVGNPEGATKEKGRAYLDECCQKIADFFVDLANAKLDDLYQ